MFALTMRYMLRNHDIDDLRTPSQTVYARVVDYMKNRLTFTSASGGMFPIRGRRGERRNDLVNYLAISQALGNSSSMVGSVDLDGSVNLTVASSPTTAGLRNASW